MVRENKENLNSICHCEELLATWQSDEIASHSFAMTGQRGHSTPTCHPWTSVSEIHASKKGNCPADNLIWGAMRHNESKWKTQDELMSELKSILPLKNKGSQRGFAQNPSCTFPYALREGQIGRSTPTCHPWTSVSEIHASKKGNCPADNLIWGAMRHNESKWGTQDELMSELKSTGRGFNAPHSTRFAQCGRSMVETLGTLAIMGILGVAGVAAYNSAMNRYRANTLINEAQRRAVVVAGQIGFNGREPSLTEFEPYNKTSAGEFGNVTTEGLYKQFGIQVSGVTKPVCKNILRTIGATTPIRRLSLESTPRTPLTSCEESNDFLFVYNENMATENDTHYCEDDLGCDECGTCNSTTHVCENECILPTNACGEDSDCNTENECMVCDTISGQCKNDCKRVEYLESTGTQYIDTGVKEKVNSQRIVCDFQYTRTGNQRLLGCYRNEVFLLVGIPYTQNDIRAQWGGNTTEKDIPTNTLDRHILDINNMGNPCYLDTNEFSLTPYTKSINLNIYLAGLNYNDSFVSGSASFAKYYGMKIWDNNTLALDFIPVLSPESSQYAGKPCMFDRVSKKLFCNQGTGDDFLTN